MTLDGFVHRVMYVNRPRLRKRTTKVPLRKTRFIDVPLRRVAVDLVGPTQPATNKGKRYILIAVDYAARFHWAVALQSIKTESVAAALVDAVR